MKKLLNYLKIFFSFTILLAGAFFLFTAFWVRRTWTKLSASSIIFQLQNSLEGTGAGMIKTFVLSAVLPAFIILLASIIFYRFIHKKNLYLMLTNICGIGLFLCAVMLVWNRVGLGDYLKYSRKKSTFIENNYAPPETVNLTFPEQKRNVIYIYLESMELTYADEEHGGAMSENLIPNLTTLAYTSDNFSGYILNSADNKSTNKTINGAYSLYGTDWTMGAMFAETSGLPLIIPIQKNSMFTQNKFFPTITTFGDILYEHGYKNVFLIGSDAEFGGRDIYFETHGNYEIQDYNYARENERIDKDYMVFWGYEDEKLFEFAKEELNTLSSSNDPFNLTLLTVDTHFEDGYTCRLCEDKYDDCYKNVISCSDRQVTAFVEWCKTQDFYKNTTIIISGDHPTMDTDFCESIDSSYNRKVYVSIINPAVDSGLDTSAMPRKYTTFDLFPTSLAAMGVHIEGDRLGLGTNLYSNIPTLLETYGFEEFNTQLMMKSDFMTKLADIDKVSGDYFLEETDKLIESLDIDITLEKADTKGLYKISCYMLTDRPSCLNYINNTYVTINDGTYSGSFLLTYNNDYSINEGRTCYETLVYIPLTENHELDFKDDNVNSLVDDSGNEKADNSISELPAHWSGEINATITITTLNHTYFSDWSNKFDVKY